MTDLDTASPPAATGATLLEARGLTKHFPTHQAVLAKGRRLVRGRPAGRGPSGPVVHAVEDVSLSLPESHITAVVGESGSGKSTLARMLARLIKPTSGTLLLGRAQGAGSQRGQ